MKCPSCNETLLISERNNIEIDYCPVCRGIWLDKGELDKMLEYADQKYAAAAASATSKPLQEYDRLAPRYSHDYDKRSHDYGKYPNHDGSYRKPMKKKSFLGDLFDFD